MLLDEPSRAHWTTRPHRSPARVATCRRISMEFLDILGQLMEFLEQIRELFGDKDD